MLPEDNDAVCPSPSCSTCSRDEVSLPSAYLIIAVNADSGRICRQSLDVSSVNTTFPAPRGSAGLPYVVYYSSFTPRTFHLQTIEVDVALKVLNKQRNGYVNVSYVSLISKVQHNGVCPQLAHRSDIRCRCSTKLALDIRFRGHDRPFGVRHRVWRYESP